MSGNASGNRDYWCHPQKGRHPTLYFHGHRLISRSEYAAAVVTRRLRFSHRNGEAGEPQAKSAQRARAVEADVRPMPGKRVNIDDETWMALDLLSRDRMATFQELADEAFADLLKKHGRPTDLKAALRKSAGVSADVVKLQDHKKARQRAAKKPKR
jgi:hypothetical protein